MTLSDPVNGDDDCGQSDEESDHAADDEDDQEGQADAEHGRVQRLLLVTFLNILQKLNESGSKFTNPQKIVINIEKLFVINAHVCGKNPFPSKEFDIIE
jgi:hypothetical protein